MTKSFQLVNGGEDFFRCLEALINGCQRELHFQTYRLEPDVTGQSVSKILLAAAKRGVTVFLLLDAYGSKNVPAEMWKEWEAAGIRARFFSPILSVEGLRLGRRLHHKVAVADGETALIGGINIADEYRGTPETEPWLDFAVRLEGDVCKTASALCAKLWGRKFFKRSPKILLPQKPPVRITHNDWFLGKNEIYRGYLREARSAKSQLNLMASYFLPNLRFRRILVRAAKRGVKVKVILPGISDVPAMKFAATWLYDFLLKNNIEVFEWHGSILHGKAMLADGRWCTIGSFNLISLSAYGSVETNVEITEKEFVAGFERRLEAVLSACTVISKEDYRKKTSWAHRVRNWFYYHLVRRLFSLVTGGKIGG